MEASLEGAFILRAEAAQKKPVQAGAPTTGHQPKGEPVARVCVCVCGASLDSNTALSHRITEPVQETFLQKDLRGPPHYHSCIWK